MDNDTISRSALKANIPELDSYDNGSYVWLKRVDVEELINNAPTVDIKDEIAGAYNEGYMCGNKEEKARAQSEWISVSKRLPEVHKKVLVSDIFGVYIGEFIDAEENWGGKHFINEHGMQSKSVVAWQPLPEPYQEGGAE